MNRRALLVLAVSAAVVLSVAAGVTLWLQRETLELRIADVAVVPNAPENGLTQLHADLVLRNVGSSLVNIDFLTLFASDPEHGTLFGTFTHTGVQLGSGGTLTFSEAANVTGHWSQVAFTVKVFPAGGPSWERSIVSDQPLTWTAW
jgi:hypothetical protein